MSEEIQQNPEQNPLAQELSEWKDKYLRLLADSENMRKRFQKEKEEMILHAIEKTISEFFPVFDNFENALKYTEKASEEVKQWASGFQMILAQFREILHEHGILAYHSTGHLFDPHFHEALEIFETDEHPEGTILEEFSKGYKSQNRVLRAARVKIAKKTLNLTEGSSPLSEDLQQEQKD